MSKFNVGDKVVSKRYPYLGEELGVIVGIDTRENAFGKYLVNFNSLDPHEGWACGIFRNDPNFIIKPYKGYAIWLEEEDLTKVEEECEEEVMSKFNVGDKVISKDNHYLSEEVGTIVGIDSRENASRKYLVKFDSLDISEGWTYRCFSDISLLIIEPFDGYAIWLDDLIKVEEECEEEVMSEFNIGDKVISKDSFYSRKEVGIIVGIDTREYACGGKYLVKFNSLSKNEGWEYEEDFRNNPDLIIEPYEGYAMWLDDLIKVEDESEEECKEEENEKDIKIEFDKAREQKKEVIKEKNEKLLELTLEIKEIEHEIEKIKKEWHLE